DQEDFTVEKLHFQALPRLYVTANLYLPKKLEQPAPAILYMCGHSRMVTNGISCGNKSWYQHHGAWFARNGYVCLIIDSLELGEILGEHHGTCRAGQWWWNARGYTPAGVEAWFGIRALDYLCSRPEVDKERIGMTGRSGGGSYTWTVAALDERVKVAAPIAGMTDLQNQVVDGVVQGHCDCMFFVNTYRWDFPQLAALIAPRPLLLGNSDKDTIFPLDGVVRLYSQTRRIYQLYGPTNKLGLLITDGPHADTQDLQVPVFRWFNRFLKGGDPLIEMAARKYFVPAQLRVFDQLPADQVNTTVQQSFVPQAQKTSSIGLADAHAQPADQLKALRQQVFAGWPAEPALLQPELAADSNQSGLRCQEYQFSSQPGIHLRLHILRDPQKPQPERLVLTVLDAPGWTNSPASGLWLGNCSPEAMADLRQDLQAGKVALAFFAPRGVEPARWLNNPAEFTQMRRRFMLLGQTLDSMRVWDIRCAAQALKSLPEFKQVPLSVRARGQMGINAAYAALFEPGLERLELAGLPASHVEGPDYLNVLKLWDIPQLLDGLGSRVEVKN
ncbi:MAG TPA: CocE/NonD family hydrolase, partial [Candidatus Sulfotelmatobacter sp.]|nr:CocE/NonD family hydrolase [Candidatus Sulfotelmatobacter sp.]